MFLNCSCGGFAMFNIVRNCDHSELKILNVEAAIAITDLFLKNHHIEKVKHIFGNTFLEVKFTSI